MFSFSGCTKKRKKVKFELWDTLLGMHATICNCHPRPQGSTQHSCAQKVMGSAFWTICFVPQHSMHRVKHAKLSFRLQLRLQSHLGPGKIITVNYQNILFLSYVLRDTSGRKKKNLSYPEVYWEMGGRCTYIHSGTHDACSPKCLQCTFLDSLLHCIP